MGLIADDDVLFHPGSLLDADGRIIAPYDIEQQPGAERGGQYHALADQPGILCAAAAPFILNYAEIAEAHIVNGMGVALGDAIIGLTALRALRQLNPRLRCLLYRPARIPAYVDQLYRLANHLVADMRSLPWRLADLPTGAPRIDLGNHLFWPDFATLPMIDFFLRALGTNPAQTPPALKTNRWLDDVCLPAPPRPWDRQDYVLFCPQSSTPLRSIPVFMHQVLVEGLWRRFGCPVLGFAAVSHTRYSDIRPRSIDTAQFLSWIKHARFVLTSDSAAVHAAAGFAVPTLALLTSIAPELRVRDYPLCQPLHLAIPALNNVHASSRREDIALVEQAYRDIDWRRFGFDQ
ncbi:ADP-heptose--LPS heptosyltransferase [Martelella alba]|uniref:ADP-heptose--LPS heptosyltransferase n=2 Tax=Martelella alba TaxID=2590451 RepID=A0ABY2SLL1_9HYPH|nr:ADP-heptose--LPS heptosyltransferase [Martelella alba]